MTNLFNIGHISHVISHYRTITRILPCRIAAVKVDLFYGRSQKLEFGGADSRRKSRPKAESGCEILGEKQQTPSPLARGSGGTLETPPVGSSQTHFLAWKTLKIRAASINFVSSTAQICIHEVTTEVGGGRPYRSLATPLICLFANYTK